MRTFVIALIFVLSFSWFVPAQPPKELTPEQKEQLKKRNSLLVEANTLYKDRKYQEAIPLVEKALRLEREILGETHDDCFASLEYLTDLYFLVEDFAAEQKTWNTLAGLREKVFGADHWKTTDAKLAAGHAGVLDKLKPEQRQLMHDATKFGIEANELYSAAKYPEALKLREKVRAIYKEVLGEKHYFYADALNLLAVAHKTLADFEKAEPLFLEAIRVGKLTYGEKHPRYANFLKNLGNCHQSHGQYTKAEPLFLEAVRIGKEAYGEKHWEYANYLFYLAMLYERQGKYDKAETLHLQVLKIRKEALGEKHADYAASLGKLGELYLSQAQYDKAEPLFLEAREIAKEAFGEKHPDYAYSLNNLANLYENRSLYAKAEPLYIEAAKIYKEAFGGKHPDYAHSLNNLALLYHLQGRFTKAEPLYIEATKIYKEALGENNLLYAGGLNNLASLFKSQGQYAKAEPLLVEALTVTKSSLGEKHPDCAGSLSNLAGLYMSHAQYAKAEPLYIEALKIWKAALGEKHPDYASGLNSLAVLHDSQGQFAKAVPLYLEALKIRKAVLGGKHPAYALCLNNLATLYMTQDQYDEAVPLCIEAMKIRKEVLGEKHPDYADSLNKLAFLYMSQREYAKAEAFYTEAMGIRKEALGEKHPEYADSVDYLAGLYKSQGLFAKAEPLYVEAMKIRKVAFGENHPDYGAGVGNLALLYKSQRLFAKAEPYCRQAVAIHQNHLEECSVIQSETDQLLHLAKVRFYLDNFLDLPETDPAVLYSAVFRWHGSVTARQAFTRLASRAAPETHAAFEELRDAVRQLNRLTQNPPAALPKAELAKQVKELDGQRDDLEKKLAGQSKDFVAYQSHLKLAPADLQKSLPEDTALLDFLAHGDKTSVFVVTKKSIVRITLETGKDLSVEIESFTGDLSLMRTRPVTNKDDVSAKLHKRVWEPLEEHLKGVTRVLICPDGPMCRLPFSALPGADPKKYLLEELSIVIVPVPQMLPGLLATDAKKLTGAPSLLAVGDVDFDGDPAAGEQPKKLLPVALARSGNGLTWNRLPNTKGEVEVVETLFKKLPQATVKKLFGNDATEAAIERELSRHRFVHLATHGFFDPPKMVRQFKDDLSAGGEKILLPSIPPGLSSGIVCAGANKPKFEASGVLTATQIAELDLRNVELAVLSACQTSLGVLSEGEGVLGLQRAFQMAGARSTISTLWGVDDRATAELMKRLYSNRLEMGLSSAEALREAQIWVLNNGDKVGAFDQKPTGSKRTPPKFWAAFSLSGDWR
jgi:CHAT domain-containing protein